MLLVKCPHLDANKLEWEDVHHIKLSWPCSSIPRSPLYALCTNSWWSSSMFGLVTRKQFENLYRLCKDALEHISISMWGSSRCADSRRSLYSGPLCCTSHCVQQKLLLTTRDAPLISSCSLHTTALYTHTAHAPDSNWNTAAAKSIWMVKSHLKFFTSIWLYNKFSNGIQTNL